MLTLLKTPSTLVNYLEFDNASDERHEYEAGQVYVRPHGNMRHNRICGNIALLLTDCLRGHAAQVFIIDVKLLVEASNNVYYPDVFIYCGSNIANEDRLVPDATVVVEVLSDSTAARDRRQKRVAYQKLPSLQAYWIVSQTEQRVEVHSREAGGPWQATAYGAGDSIPNPWLGDDAMSLTAIYAGTDIAT